MSSQKPPPWFALALYGVLVACALACSAGCGDPSDSEYLSLSDSSDNSPHAVVGSYLVDGLDGPTALVKNDPYAPPDQKVYAPLSNGEHPAVAASKLEPCMFAACFTLHYRLLPGRKTLNALIAVDGIEAVTRSLYRYSVQVSHGEAFTLEEVAANLHVAGLLEEDALPVKQPAHVTSSVDMSPNVVGSDGDVVITYGGGR